MAASQWIERAQQAARDVLCKHAAEVDRLARWPDESIAALAHAGLLGLTVPTDLGGAGQGPSTFAGATRTLAQQCASTAMIYLMHVCATQVVAEAESFAKRAAVLTEIAAGQHVSTLAFSERGSRSHFWAPVSQAADRGEVHQVNARKSWVTSAGKADSYVVSTRSAAATDPLASTLYFVPASAPGLSVQGNWNGLGLRGNASAPVDLNDVRVPSSDRLCAEGEGFQAMLNIALPWFQLGSAAVSLGIAQAATESTKQHLLSARLEHLDQSLASLPNLRARLAQMQILVDTQRAFLDHVAARMQDPGPDTLLAVLESKASAAEAALVVTDLALRTCGGAGFSGHLTVDRNFRDAQAGRAMAPTTDLLHDFIGKALLDLPLF
jgi:alkylation response protein AidB-like acyl-CoA dehydrogenase